MAKLFTKHDPYHAHKTLGLLCLLHFAYRYGWQLAQEGHLGVGVPWIAAHMLLSASALLFRVPAKRIRANPTTIWREYQLHAVLFTARCGVVWALPAATGPLLRYATVMPWHAAADWVSARHGDSGSTTVRGRHGKTKSATVRAMVLAYGAYQHLALASHLVPAHTPGAGFNALIAIQSSALGMTLVRKGLWGWRHHAAFYSACLGLSAHFICAHVLSGAQLALAAAAYIARTKAGISKYIAWAAFCLAPVATRPALGSGTPVPA